MTLTLRAAATDAAAAAADAEAEAEACETLCGAGGFRDDATVTPSAAELQGSSYHCACTLWWDHAKIVRKYR